MSVLPIVTPAGEGDALQFSPTELLMWKATQATTGAFDQFELTAQPNHAGAPLHVHAAVEECFYVLAGAFRFAVASSEVIAGPGSFLFVPRGTAHTWTNAAQTASTMLLTFVPGGMKLFFDEAAPSCTPTPSTSTRSRPSTPATPRPSSGHRCPRSRTRRPPGAVTT